MTDGPSESDVPQGTAGAINACTLVWDNKTAACTIGLHSTCWVSAPTLARLATIHGELCCTRPCHTRTIDATPGEAEELVPTAAQKRMGHSRATGEADTTDATGATGAQIGDQWHTQRLAFRMLGAGCPLAEIAAATDFTTQELELIRDAVTERMMIGSFLNMGRNKDLHGHD